MPTAQTMKSKCSNTFKWASKSYKIIHCLIHHLLIAHSVDVVGTRLEELLLSLELRQLSNHEEQMKELQNKTTTESKYYYVSNNQHNTITFSMKDGLKDWKHWMNEE